VQSVAGTRIFARGLASGPQLLAYQMTISAAEDVAMILPLPVPLGTVDGAVRFIDLEGYGAFFDDLKAGFPDPPPPPNAHGRRKGIANFQAIEVIQVGSFEASFVPTVKDFARLDPRFRLPEGIWDALPDYKSYGFAVFKLKKDAHNFHPMAFAFPRADPGKLFFPTVHIHDGRVHPEADFDHALYAQFPDDGRPAGCQPGSPPGWWQIGRRKSNEACTWRESEGHAGQFMKVDDAKGLVDASAHCYLVTMRGPLPNRDTWA
jgi:hypothetical protein